MKYIFVIILRTMPFGAEIDESHIAIEVPQGVYSENVCKRKMYQIWSYKDDRFDAACLPRDNGKTEFKY